MSDKRHAIFYGRSLSMAQPQTQTPPESIYDTSSLDDLIVIEQLKEIKSWLPFSIVNVVIFFPLIFWMIPLHYSFQVRLFIKKKQLNQAQSTSYSALKTNIFVTFIGIFTYTWLIPALVFILISNKNS